MPSGLPQYSKVTFASVRPTRSLNLLSHREVAGLMASNDELYQLFRECALAVLNTGGEEDDGAHTLAVYHDFNIIVRQQSRGIKLDIYNAPATAFVDGRMIRGIQEHLFSALRDIVYSHHKLTREKKFDFDSTEGITDGVFRVLRNAGVVKPDHMPNLVVCWGGHAIDRLEYDYTKRVGYQLGLRGLDIATGCGIGAMKGPMKGALVGHGKQQISHGRYVGITEPGIITSESPNPAVNELVILPDIEKRLEAFVRLAHCIVVFPGGAGTVEEVLYLIGLAMHPDNTDIPLPVIFTAPKEREAYVLQLDQFIRGALGEAAAAYYEIIMGDSEQVARRVKYHVERVKRHRRHTNESYAYNWQLTVPNELQQPFIPEHTAMAALNLAKAQPAYQLTAQLRKAFSGIVAGNVKAFGIERIAEYGPYQLQGDPQVIDAMDNLLADFVADGRMKLKGDYKPCYTLKSVNS